MAGSAASHRGLSNGEENELIVSSINLMNSLKAG
jgi:hypothetical protein